MEVIITQSQLLLLLLEQTSNVYTDKALYDKALKKYNLVWEAYNQSERIYDYFKNHDFLIPSSIKINVSNKDLIVKYLFDDYKKTTKRTLTEYEIIKIMKSNKILPKFTYFFIISAAPNTSDKYFKKVEYRGNSWTTSFKTIDVMFDFFVYNTTTIPKPIYKAPEPVVKPTPPVTKTPPVVNYKEVISNVTTFGTPYKTGTRAIELNIPGGPYYLTYPEFEAYKKTRPNTTFKKI